jgi:quercetin dioxygenase-like cupin family protein
MALAGLTLIIVVSAWSAAVAADASPHPTGRTVLQVATDVQRVELAEAYLARNGAGPRHTHAGIETALVMEGEVILEIDGQPAKTLTAGQSFLVPRGVAHSARGGPDGARVIGAWVIDRAAPTSQPAP